MASRDCSDVGIRAIDVPAIGRNRVSAQELFPVRFINFPFVGMLTNKKLAELAAASLRLAAIRASVMSHVSRQLLDTSVW